MKTSYEVFASVIITKEESKAFEDPEKAMELRRALEHEMNVRAPSRLGLNSY